MSEPTTSANPVNPTTTVDLDNAAVAEPLTGTTQPHKDPVVPAPGSVLRAAGAQPDAPAPSEEALAQALAGESEQPAAEQPPAEQEQPHEDPDDDDDSEWKDPAAEHVDDKVRETVLEKDLYLNQVTTGGRDPTQIAKVLRKFYPDEKSQQRAAEDPLSLYNILLLAFKQGWGTNQNASYYSALSAKQPDGSTAMDHLVAIKETGLEDKTANKIRHSSVDLTGQDAYNAFMSRMCGFKKINLLNSGFWVSVRRPVIDELQDMYDIIDMEQKELGYAIGSHFALCTDMFVKMKFCELLIKFKIIVDSNLKGVYKDNNFISALSIHDYDVLMHGVLSLMSRKGIRLRMVCPECIKATIVDNVDISTARYVNRNLLTPAVREWWAKPAVGQDGKRVLYSLKDLENYREKILNFNMQFNTTIGDANIRFNLHVPTMAEYYEDGTLLLNRLQEIIESSSDVDTRRSQQLMSNIDAHFVKMIAPWVRNIEELDEQGNVVTRTDDSKTIIGILDIATQEQTDVPFDKFTEFLGASKITFVGTYALECPHCHAKPDVGLKDQFYPLEVQSIFFGQMFRLLPPELTRPAQ